MVINFLSSNTRLPWVVRQTGAELGFLAAPFPSNSLHHVAARSASHRPTFLESSPGVDTVGMRIPRRQRIQSCGMAAQMPVGA